MPMDIRSFFGKADPNKKTPTTTKAAVAAPALAARRKQVAPSRTTSSTGTSTSNNKDNGSTKKADSGSSDDGNPLVVADAAKPNKQRSSPRTNTRKRYAIESSSEDEESKSDNENDDDDSEVVVEPPPAKRTAVATTTKPSVAATTKKRKSEERKEISPQDFFGKNDESESSPAAAQPSPSKKAKIAKKPLASAASGSASKPKPIKKEPSSSAKKKTEKEIHKDALLQPTRRAKKASVFSSDKLRPGCLNGISFVFTGVLDNLSRDDAQEIIRELGGRVTTAVSGKTDYLVYGPVLEDGRPYDQGSKYKKAKESDTIVVEGEEEFYGLVLQYDDKARADAGEPPRNDEDTADDDDVGDKLGRVSSSRVAASPVLSKSPSLKSPPPDTAAAKAPPPTFADPSSSVPTPVVSAPKQPVQNPYAKLKSNPYAKKPAATAATVASAPVTSASIPAAAKNNGDGSASSTNQLWVDKYKPKSTKDILGNQENAKKLSAWLGLWEERFNTPRAVGKAFSGPNGPWKAALLSGPPGIGKTTTATLVAQESGRDVIEFNASDVRSKNSLRDNLGDITGSQTIEFNSKNKKRTKRCIIMDEVDGMGAGDRGGIASLIQIIKHSQVPIICICNDRQAQQIKSLVPYCFDLRFRRPVKSVLAKRAIEIASKEHLLVEFNGAELLSESCGNDVRQVINALQMWASDANQCKMTYKDLKQRQHAISKDEMLRVSLFDAAKIILEGRRGLSNSDFHAERDHFFKRTDAFFVDYSFVGLLVHQNYLKVVQGDMNSAMRNKDDDATVCVLERMYSAAESMSDYDLVGTKMMETQNWSLLPFSSICAIKTGFHAGGPNGGFMPGFPEFTSLLGKNSSRSKNMRLLQELQHHTNYHTSGGLHEMRTAYIPMFRERFLSLLKEDEGAGVDAAIQLMDEYGLDRDDVFETLDEFKVDKKADTFDKIDSRKKAAFTRSYNERAHKSQALVAEQGASKTKKRVAASSGGETPKDLDVIDEDAAAPEEEEEEDIDDDADHAKIKAMFKSSSRKGKKAATGKASNGKASGAGASKAATKGKGRAKK